MKQKLIEHAKALITKMFETGDSAERMALMNEIRELLNTFPELRERMIE